MKVEYIEPNFIYPDIQPEHFVFGSDQVLGTVLCESGDWRDFVPPFEDQRRYGVESSACYVEASQHAIAVIQEKQYSLADQNYSARFNVIVSSGTSKGGDPLKAGQSFRDAGLIVEDMLPFSEEIDSWNDFASFKGADERLCRIAGRQWRLRWNPKYDIVFQKHESAEAKMAKLKEALKYSPVPMSVRAWVSKDGVYVKPNGLDDQHLVLCLYVDEENHPYVLDTYFPYIKKLEKNYNSDFAMRWTLEKIEYSETNRGALAFIDSVIGWLTSIFRKEKPAEIPEVAPSPKLVVLKKTNAERLYEEAFRSLGIDITPKDNTPDDVACAETVSTLIRRIVPDFPIITGTWTLLQYLSKSPLFEQIKEPELGCIYLCATGTGNGDIKNGHTGILGKDDRIFSNNSITGTLDNHFTKKAWDDRYIKRGGFPLYLFRLK